MCTYLDQVNGTYYFRRVVPVDLRSCITTNRGGPRAEWKMSLRTKDREVAKKRIPHYVIHTDKLLDLARHTTRLAAASGNGPYSARSDHHTDEAASYAESLERRQSEWSEEGADLAMAQREEQELRHDAREADRVYWKKRIFFTTLEMTPREAAVKDLLAEADFDHDVALAEIKFLRDALSQARKSGDPTLLTKVHRTVKSSCGRSILQMFDDYAADQGLKPGTCSEWRATVAALIKFIGHDDVAQLTADEIDTWKKSLLRGITNRGTIRSPLTVKSKYLVGIRAALNWGVEQRYIKENVAAGITVRIPRKAKLRDRSFTKIEIAKILSATLVQQPNYLSVEMARARRWIPWLCAYTGARVNEISQLRGIDIIQIEGVWVIRITPEAGTVKANEARLVPIHPHLINQGFVNVAQKSGNKPIFYDPGKVLKAGEANRYIKKVGERMAIWIRTDVGINDPNVQPNHGWRHTFKTMSIQASIPERVADAIQGHAARSVGQSYGSVPIKTLADAIEKIPYLNIAR